MYSSSIVAGIVHLFFLTSCRISLHPENGILGIPGGGFRTPDSRLVERFRLLKNGQILQVISTWTDPKVFRTPHTYELRYIRLPRDYEARPNAVCDPYDEERAQLFSGPPKVTP